MMEMMMIMVAMRWWWWWWWVDENSSAPSLIELEEQTHKTHKCITHLNSSWCWKRWGEKLSSPLSFPPSRGYKLRKKEEELVPLCIIDGVVMTTCLSSCHFLFIYLLNYYKLDNSPPPLAHKLAYKSLGNWGKKKI